MAENGEAEAQASTLSEVFPGEAVELKSLGRHIIVTEWRARMLTREVPVKLAAIVRAMRAAGGDPAERMLAAAMPELVSLVLLTAGLQEADLDRMTAGELMRLAAAGVRQNRDFFAGLAEVLKVAQEDFGAAAPAGSASPPP